MSHDEKALIDLSRMMDRFDHDWDLLREVMSVFASEAPERRRRITEALDGGDMEQLVRLAHSLKGVCGTIHAEPLRELSLRVEMAARAGDATEVGEITPHLLAMLGNLADYLETVAASQTPLA
jgi:HPt (histidine-containing phosphotransfer) domain-containing protein